MQTWGAQIVDDEARAPASSIDGDADDRMEQVYDTAMRRWAEPSLPFVLGWLDPAVKGLPPVAYTQRPSTLATTKIEADLVATAGRNRILHVEYETRPRAGLVTRMLNYRARLMAVRPEVHLTQHVIVLGSGLVQGHQDPARGFTLDLKVIYLRERDPTEFLTDPMLAPFASLTRGPRARREKSFAAALRLLRDCTHPRRDELIEFADTLASIRLDTSTISRIRKENGMRPDALDEYYATTEMGQAIAAPVVRKKQQQMLTTLLTRRFDHDTAIAGVAARLAGWPQTAAIDAVLDLPDLAALEAVEPPPAVTGS